MPPDDPVVPVRVWGEEREEEQGHVPGAPHVPGQGEKRETEANWLMLLQQVCSRNNTRDQPPGFPLSVTMRSLCSMKEEKFPAIQNTQGKRQAAEPSMPVPVQQVAVVGSNLVIPG